jgi:hypothetical protein
MVFVLDSWYKNSAITGTHCGIQWEVLLAKITCAILWLQLSNFSVLWRGGFSIYGPLQVFVENWEFIIKLSCRTEVGWLSKLNVLTWLCK